MVESNNRVMNIIALMVLVLSLIVHSLHRLMHAFHNGSHPPGWLLNVFMLLPIVVYIMAIILYYEKIGILLMSTVLFALQHNKLLSN